jgi:hypothetical protein
VEADGVAELGCAWIERFQVRLESDKAKQVGSVLWVELDATWALGARFGRSIAKG